MPCATVHLYLSDRILSHWEGEPGSSPFSAADPVLRDAFLHGSLAPDMGFVPGVDRFVSELAHYSTPADLTRNLIRSARTPRETAFAWGWASHVAGDVVLHPTVGQAVGERLRGDRSVRMNAEDDLPTHVAMEVGLDLALLARVPAISPPPPAPFLSGENVGFLARALRATYGLSWSTGALVAGHHRAVRLTTCWPRAIRLVAPGASARRKSGGAVRRVASATVRAVGLAGRRLTGADSALRGFLRPIVPPAWLVDRVVTSSEGLVQLLESMVQEGLHILENRNLETGEEAGPGLGHPPSDAVEKELKHRRGSEARPGRGIEDRGALSRR